MRTPNQYQGVYIQSITTKCRKAVNLNVELASRTAAVVKGFNVLRVVTQLLRTDRKRVSYQCCRQSEEVGRDMEGLE